MDLYGELTAGGESLYPQPVNQGTKACCRKRDISSDVYNKFLETEYTSFCCSTLLLHVLV